MSQTSIIAATLIVAYIIFVTVRGDLPNWLYALGIGNQPDSGCVPPTAESSCAWWDYPCKIAAALTQK